MIIFILHHMKLKYRGRACLGAAALCVLRAAPGAFYTNVVLCVYIYIYIHIHTYVYIYI